jgi:hypothetical protein
MRRLRFLGLTLALLGGGAAHAQDAASLTDPVALFGAACASGQARLPRTKFDDVAYLATPLAARRAYALAARVPGKGGAVTPFGDLEVPNRVLVRLPDRELYLILAAEGAEGAAAETCGVIWKGTHFDDAATAIGGYRADSATTAAPQLPAGARYTGFIGHAGTRMSGVELDQWTALAIVPDTTKEQKTP